MYEETKKERNKKQTYPERHGSSASRSEQRKSAGSSASPQCKQHAAVEALAGAVRITSRRKREGGVPQRAAQQQRRLQALRKQHAAVEALAGAV